MTTKRYKHYKEITNQSILKYSELLGAVLKDYSHIISDWEKFLNDEPLIALLDRNIDNFSALLGFSRELSSNLNANELTSRVIERFAEIDMFKHIIREFNIDNSVEVITKLSESSDPVVEFQLGNQLFEAKYTTNPKIKNIESIVKKAKKKFPHDNNIKGHIWIFTNSTKQTGNPREYQKLVTKIKKENLNSVSLTVQIHGHGLYGDSAFV